jgi:hypothetical protein
MANGTYIRSYQWHSYSTMIKKCHVAAVNFLEMMTSTLPQGYVAPCWKSSLQQNITSSSRTEWALRHIHFSKERFLFFRRIFFCHLSPTRLLPTCTMWVTRWVSYKKKDLLIVLQHLGSLTIFGGVHVVDLFNFLGSMSLICFIFWGSCRWSV